MRMGDFMQDYFSKLADHLIAAVPNILAALFIFLLSLYLARLLGNLLRRVLLKRNTASSVTHLLADILGWTVIVFGAVTALQRFFNVTAFLTGLGIIGFTVGFALQNVLQNFVSGIILLAQQPFNVGDEIQVLNFEGLVLQINIRTTEMQATDGRIVILPNAEVISHPIVNYTRANRRRVDLSLQISAQTDPEQVRPLILNEVRDIAGFVHSPSPEVVFQNLEQDFIKLQTFFWVDTSLISTTTAKDQALVRLKAAFKKNRIKLSPRGIYLESAN
jgi:small conductance mechanosensitive channel